MTQQSALADPAPSNVTPITPLQRLEETRRKDGESGAEWNERLMTLNRRDRQQKILDVLEETRLTAFTPEKKSQVLKFSAAKYEYLLMLTTRLTGMAFGRIEAKRGEIERLRCCVNEAHATESRMNKRMAELEDRLAARMTDLEGQINDTGHFE